MRSGSQIIRVLITDGEMPERRIRSNDLSTKTTTETYSGPKRGALPWCAARILDIAFRNRLGHIGSCLTALPIIHHVYSTKRPDDRCILSAGHSGLALYVVLEAFGIIPDAEARLLADGIHPVRGPGIDVTTGSLGQGITVGAGLALARPERDVYIISTDGEVAEGAFWETLFFASQYPLNNLIIYINDNGYSALRKTSFVEGALSSFDVNVIDTSDQLPRLPGGEWLRGLEAHYHVMTEAEYLILRRFYDPAT